MITIKELFFVIAIILIILSVIFFNHLEEDDEDQTNTPYECGFIPFTSDFPNNNIKFFVHAILFLVFDLEILILLPLSLSNVNNTWIMWLMASALIILIIMATYIEIKQKMFSMDVRTKKRIPSKKRPSAKRISTERYIRNIRLQRYAANGLQ